MCLFVRAVTWCAGAPRAVPTVALAVRHAAPLRDPAVLARRETAQHKLAVALGEVPANIRAVTLGDQHCIRLLQPYREFEGRVAGVLVPHAIDKIAALEADHALRSSGYGHCGSTLG